MKLSRGKINKLHKNKNQTSKNNKKKKIQKITNSKKKYNKKDFNIRNVSLKNSIKGGSNLNNALQYFKDPFKSSWNYFFPKAHRVAFKSILLKKNITDEIINNDNATLNISNNLSKIDGDLLDFTKKSLETINQELEFNKKSVEKNKEKLASLRLEVDTFENKIFSSVNNLISSKLNLINNENKVLDETIDKTIKTNDLHQKSMKNNIRNAQKIKISSEEKINNEITSAEIKDTSTENKKSDLITNKYSINKSDDFQKGGGSKRTHSGVEIPKTYTPNDKDMYLYFNSSSSIPDKDSIKHYLEYGNTYKKDLLDIQSNMKNFINIVNNIEKLHLNKNIINSNQKSNNNLDVEIGKASTIYDNFTPLFNKYFKNKNSKINFNTKKVENYFKEISNFSDKNITTGLVTFLKKIKREFFRIRTVIDGKVKNSFYKLKKLEEMINELSENKNKEELDLVFKNKLDELNIYEQNSKLYEFDNSVSKYLNSVQENDQIIEMTKEQLTELKKLNESMEHFTSYNKNIKSIRENYLNIILCFLNLSIKLLRRLTRNTTATNISNKFSDDENIEKSCIKIMKMIIIPLTGSGTEIEGDINSNFNVIKGILFDTNFDSVNGVRRPFIITSGLNNDFVNIDDYLSYDLIKKGLVTSYMTDSGDDLDSRNIVLSTFESMMTNFRKSKLTTNFVKGFADLINWTSQVEKFGDSIEDFFMEISQQAYTNEDELEIPKKINEIIKKITKVFRNYKYKHFVFQTFTGEDFPLVVDVNSATYLSISTADIEAIDKTLKDNSDELNNLSNKHQKLEEKLSEVFSKIKLELFDYDGILPYYNNKLNLELVENFGYHNNNNEIKKILKAVSGKSISDNQEVKKETVNKIIDLFFYGIKNKSSTDDIYKHISKYCTIDYINEFLSSKITILDSQMEKTLQNSDETLTSENSLLKNYFAYLLNYVDDSVKSNDIFIQQFLVIHNLIINKNINNQEITLTKNNLHKSIVGLEDDNLYFFEDEYDINLKRANLSNKIDEYESMLAYLYYFNKLELNSNTTSILEYPIDKLLYKINYLKNEFIALNQQFNYYSDLATNDPNQFDIESQNPKDGRLKWEQVKIINDNLNLEVIIEKFETFFNELKFKFEILEVSIEQYMAIHTKESRETVEKGFIKKYNYDYIIFIRESLYKNIYLDEYDSFMQDTISNIKEKEDELKEMFKNELTLRQKGNDNSNPLKQINLSNILSLLDGEEQLIENHKDKFSEFIKEYETRLQNKKVDLNKKIQFSAFDSRRINKHNKFKEYITKLINDMSDEEKIQKGIIVKGFFMNDNFYPEETIENLNLSEPQPKLEFKDFSQEIIDNAYDNSLVLNYSQNFGIMEDNSKSSGYGIYDEKGAIVYLNTYLIPKHRAELVYNSSKQFETFKTYKINGKNVNNKRLFQNEKKYLKSEKKGLSKDFIDSMTKEEDDIKSKSLAFNSYLQQFPSLKNKSLHEIEKFIENHSNKFKMKLLSDKESVANKIKDFNNEKFQNKLEELNKSVNNLLQKIQSKHDAAENISNEDVTKIAVSNLDLNNTSQKEIAEEREKVKSELIKKESEDKKDNSVKKTIDQRLSNSLKQNLLTKKNKNRQQEKLKELFSRRQLIQNENEVKLKKEEEEKKIEEEKKEKERLEKIEKEKANKLAKELEIKKKEEERKTNERNNYEKLKKEVEEMENNQNDDKEEFSNLNDLIKKSENKSEQPKDNIEELNELNETYAPLGEENLLDLLKFNIKEDEELKDTIKRYKSSKKQEQHTYFVAKRMKGMNNPNGIPYHELKENVEKSDSFKIASLLFSNEVRDYNIAQTLKSIEKAKENTKLEKVKIINNRKQEENKKRKEEEDKKKEEEDKIEKKKKEEEDKKEKERLEKIQKEKEENEKKELDRQNEIKNIIRKKLIQNLSNRTNDKEIMKELSEPMNETVFEKIREEQLEKNPKLKPVSRMSVVAPPKNLPTPVEKPTKNILLGSLDEEKDEEKEKHITVNESFDKFKVQLLEMIKKDKPQYKTLVKNNDDFIKILIKNTQPHLRDNLDSIVNTYEDYKADLTTNLGKTNVQNMIISYYMTPSITRRELMGLRNNKDWSPGNKEYENYDKLYNDMMMIDNSGKKTDKVSLNLQPLGSKDKLKKFNERMKAKLEKQETNYFDAPETVTTNRPSSAPGISNNPVKSTLLTSKDDSKKRVPHYMQKTSASKGHEIKPKKQAWKGGASDLPLDDDEDIEFNDNKDLIINQENYNIFPESLFLNFQSSLSNIFMPHYETINEKKSLTNISIPYKPGNKIGKIYEFPVLLNSNPQILHKAFGKNLEETNKLILERDLLIKKINQLYDLKNTLSINYSNPNENQSIQTCVVNFVSNKNEFINLKFDTRINEINSIFKEIVSKRDDNEIPIINEAVKKLNNKESFGYKHTLYKVDTTLDKNVKSKDKVKILTSSEVVSLYEIFDYFFIDFIKSKYSSKITRLNEKIKYSENKNKFKLEMKKKTILNKYKTFVLKFYYLLLNFTRQESIPLHEITKPSNENIDKKSIYFFKNYYCTILDFISFIDYLNTNIDIKFLINDGNKDIINKLFVEYKSFDLNYLETKDPNENKENKNIFSKLFGKSYSPDDPRKLKVYDQIDLDKTKLYTPYLNFFGGNKNVKAFEEFTKLNETRDFASNMLMYQYLDNKSDDKLSKEYNSLIDNLKKYSLVVQNMQDKREKSNMLIKNDIDNVSKLNKKLKIASQGSSFITDRQDGFESLRNNLAKNEKYDVNLVNYLNPGESGDDIIDLSKEDLTDEVLCDDVGELFYTLEVIFDLFRNKETIPKIDYENDSIQKIIDTYRNLKKNITTLSYRFFKLNIINEKIKQVLKQQSNISQARKMYLKDVVNLLEFIQKNIFKFRITFMPNSKKTIGSVLFITRYGANEEDFDDEFVPMEVDNTSEDNESIKDEDINEASKELENLDKNDIILDNKRVKTQKSSNEKSVSFAPNIETTQPTPPPTAPPTAPPIVEPKLQETSTEKWNKFNKTMRETYYDLTDDNLKMAKSMWINENGNVIPTNKDEYYVLIKTRYIDKDSSYFNDDNSDDSSYVPSEQSDISEEINLRGGFKKPNFTKSTKRFLKKMFSNFYTKIVKTYRKTFRKSNLFEITIDMRRLMDSVNPDTLNVEDNQSNFDINTKFQDIGFTEHLSDINKLSELYNDIFTTTRNVFKKDIIVKFKTLITSISFYELQSNPSNECIEKIRNSLFNISKVFDDLQEELTKKQEEDKQKLIEKRREILNHKLEQVNKKAEELKEKYKEEDNRIEQEKEQMEKEKEGKEEENKKLDEVLLGKKSSKNMYFDAFANEAKPIPNNPDYDIVYLANQKEVDITKLDREQKKKLLEFTARERNFKLNSEGQTEVVEKMKEYDTKTIISEIDGNSADKAPEFIQDLRDSKNITPPTSEKTPAPVPAPAPGQVDTSTSSTVQQENAVETKTAKGETKEGPPGEKSIVTNIKPDGSVTVTTKVLKDENGKDFIIDSHTDTNKQSGINTIINLAKKLNGDKTFKS